MRSFKKIARQVTPPDGCMLSGRCSATWPLKVTPHPAQSMGNIIIPRNSRFVKRPGYPPFRAPSCN